MQAFARQAVVVVTFCFAIGGSCAKISSQSPVGNGSDAGNGSNSDVQLSRQIYDAVTISGTVLKTCGNGQLDLSEFCDDGNKVGNDGCSQLCQIEAGWTCPLVGKPCTNMAVCGDGMLSASEACDDGNMAGGDGCAADCRSVDPGYQCRVPGRNCVPLCGDGMVIGAEKCDDANAVSGDGCSSTCLLEPGASCAAPGQPCKSAKCGNGMVEEGESCDAGGANGLFFGDGTGCSKTCTKEPKCRDGNGMTRACDVSCGNGNLEPPGEECDDGNMANGDGCSSICKVEMGFMCPPEMKPDTEPCVPDATMQCLHLPIIVRDFKSEHETGGHPDFFYYGAPVTPAITVAGVATNPNLSFSKRYCVSNSSGPVRQNDSTARCWDIAQPTLDTRGKPAFNATRTGGNLCDCQFTDWSHDTNGGRVPGYTQVANGPTNGLVYTAGMVGHPMYKGPAPIVKDATSFGQWFVDSAFTNNTHSVVTLQLSPFGTGQYRFSSDPNSVTGGFFPADPPGTTPPPGTIRMVPGTNEPLLCNLWPYWYSTAGFGAGANCIADQYVFPPSIPAGLCTATPAAGQVACAGGLWLAKAQGTFHNSWYSTEARYLFNFNGPFELQFYGDDDLYIYVNGHLVIDLGGVHQRLPGRVQVAADGMGTIVEGGEIDPNTGVINPCTPATANPYTLQLDNATCPGGNCDCRNRTVDLGLKMGSTYEIAVFQADRHPTEANYQLTLSGFSTNKSNCQAKCGDKVVSGAEECDDGPMNNDTAYGGCTTMCKFGPFCGDGMKDGTEECDLGRDNVKFYGTKDGCTTACKFPHYCGDRMVDASNGEQCDQGEALNGTPSSLCDAHCKVAIQ